MDERMQAVEKKDRFLERRDRIIARFSGSDREGFLKRLREAEFAILALDADRGIRVLEELFRSDRANVELGFYLAETFFSAGELERASILRKILAVDPSHFEAPLTADRASELGDTATARPRSSTRSRKTLRRFLPHSPSAPLRAPPALGGRPKGLGRALDPARFPPSTS